ncbi:MAG: hypothetical protein ACR2IH_14355 [Pyrinomonadaceae bacterium]
MAISEIESKETWRVEAVGKIYTASYSDLPVWIDDGSLQPHDLVQKGNRRWLEAGKVPELRMLFENRAACLGPGAEDTQGRPNAVRKGITKRQELREVDVHVSIPTIPCSVHSETAAALQCGKCDENFCRSCTKSFGGNVKLCPKCGALCHSIKELESKRMAAEMTARDVGKGFGAGDFAKALAFPFRHKTSLIAGAAMFTFFSIGQSAFGFGDVLMIVAAIFCLLLANMIWFGVLANTIDNVSRGIFTASFMPAFDDFSPWDDVLHPFLLSIGVYLSSFGPFLIALGIGFYLVASMVSSQMSSFQNEVEKIPGTPYYSAKDTVKQSDAVKDLIAETKRQTDARLALQNEIQTGKMNPDSAVILEADAATTITDEQVVARRKQIEAELGTSDHATSQTIQGLLGLAPPLVIIALIAFLWGVFYFPAACAVGSFTKSFGSAINPLIGLDTIRRMGWIYLKLLLMSISVGIAIVVLSAMVGSVFAAFNIPGMGNIPAKIVLSMFIFYATIVFACLVGAAMFKASDRLQLQT